MFARLGPWCHDRRRLVVVLWIVAFVIGGFMSASGGSFKDEFNPPASDSTDGLDLLKEHFGGAGAGFSGQIVFRADQGVDDPEVEAAMTALFEKVAEVDEVQGVQSPYDPETGGRLIAAEGPEAGKIAYASVELPEGSDQADAEVVRDAIIEATPDIDGLVVER